MKVCMATKGKAGLNKFGVPQPSEGYEYAYQVVQSFAQVYLASIILPGCSSI